MRTTEQDCGCVVTDHGNNEMRLRPCAQHGGVATPEQQLTTLRAELAALHAKLDQVDDVLIVNWCGPRVDGDYQKALADLIEFNIQIHDDPSVSKVARDRRAELAAREADVGMLREALEPFVGCQPRWCSIGSIENIAEVRVNRAAWKDAHTAWASTAHAAADWEAKVRREERERCAKIARDTELENYTECSRETQRWVNDAAQQIAEAILAPPTTPTTPEET